MKHSFNNWLAEMRTRPDKDRHEFAVFVSFLLGAVVCFFVASSWYFRLSDNSIPVDYFSDLEQFVAAQKTIFSNFKEGFNDSSVSIKEVVNVYNELGTTYVNGDAESVATSTASVTQVLYEN